MFELFMFISGFDVFDVVSYSPIFLGSLRSAILIQPPPLAVRLYLSWLEVPRYSSQLFLN